MAPIVFFPQLHAKTELECGTLLLFIHLNLAPAVKENENLMHCINLGAINVTSVNLKKAGMASRNVVIKNNSRCFKSALLK